MADELKYYGNLDETGLTVIARVFDSLGSQVGGDVSLIETGTSAIYIGDMVTAPAGEYGVRIIDSGSGGLLGQGTIKWDGTEEVEILGLVDTVSKYPELYFSISLGSPGQVLGVNATPTNPSDSNNDIIAIQAASNLPISILDGTLSPSSFNAGAVVRGAKGTGLDLIGETYSLDNVDISGVEFNGFEVIDISSSYFTDCKITGITADSIANSKFIRCFFEDFGDVNSSVNSNEFIDCFVDGWPTVTAILNTFKDSRVVTTTAITGGNNFYSCQLTNLRVGNTGAIPAQIHDCTGPINIISTNSGPVTIEGGAGSIFIDSGAAGIITVIGRAEDSVVDNSGGTATVNIEDARGGGGGLDEAQLHTGLDNYTNKNDWKATIDIAAIVTAVWSAATRSLTDKSGFELTTAQHTAIATAVEAAIINEGDGQQVIDAILQVFNANLDIPALELTAIAQAVRTELDTELGRIDVSMSSRAAQTDLTTLAAAVALIPTTDSVADLTPVLNAITNLNDVTPAQVRAAFDEAEFKDKNTESEVHAWLDSYTNKDDWKASNITIDPIVEDKIDQINSNTQHNT